MLTTRFASLLRRKWMILALVAGISSSFAFTQNAQNTQPAQTAPQVWQTLPTYQGQNVTTVELAGQPNLDRAAYEPLLAQKPGTPLSKEKVEASMRALRATGKFKAIDMELRPDSKGIRLLFVLEPAYYYGVFEFPGATNKALEFPYVRLVQVSNYPPRGAYSNVDVQNARRALETFFHRSGFFQAKVTPRLQLDQSHLLVNIYFDTVLGPRAKFGNVIITGTTPQETAKLKGKLHSIMSRLKSSSVIQGKSFSSKHLQNAVTYLEDTLMSQNHLAGQVKLIGAAYNPATNRADVTFKVQTGPTVNVKVQGAHLWSWTKKKLLPVYQQAGLDPELIQEGRQNLISHFEQQGYFGVTVRTTVRKQGSTESIVYLIDKGHRHKVTDVDVAGNKALPTSELQKQITVQQAHLFSHGDFSDKLVKQSADNLKSLYQANGFSDVKVTPQVASGPNGNVQVTFRVDEGQPDVVEALKVEGNATVPRDQLARGGLKVEAGQPYSQKLVNEDRDHIMAAYLTKGYLNADFRATVNTVGGDKHKLDVVYHIQEGPKVDTTNVVLLGNHATKPATIDRATELSSGEPMREDKLLASEDKLYNLGIFDWASVDPRRAITTQTQEAAVVKVHEARENTITYGFGFEVINRGGSIPSGTVALPGLPPVGLPSNFKTNTKTFWGPRGTFQYTRLNFRGRAQTLTFTALGARLDQRFSFGYLDPHFRGTNWSSNLTLGGEHDAQNPIFSSRLADIGEQFQRALNPDKTENLFLRYGFRETGLTNLLIPALVLPADRHIRLSTFSGTFIRDTRDSVLDATKGFYETAELGMNATQLGSSVSFARFMGQAAYYKKIFGGIVFANSLRLGLEQPYSGSRVPLSEKFFTGGGSTLRGFPLNGAGPQRQVPVCSTPGDSSSCSFIQVPVGGNQLFILNSELRIPIPIDFPLIGKNLGVATFYDGGNVYQNVGFHGFFANYTNSIGAGLRYHTPVGPVRIDIGHLLNAPPGIKSTQIFVTLGQAF
jgi:outer membrane protein insertion porin family